MQLFLGINMWLDLIRHGSRSAKPQNMGMHVDLNAVLLSLNATLVLSDFVLSQHLSPYTLVNYNHDIKK